MLTSQSILINKPYILYNKESLWYQFYFWQMLFYCFNKTCVALQMRIVFGSSVQASTLTNLYSMSCRMLTAMMTRGFLPLFREKMVRLDESISVVFSVSAAVPAPQQLQTAKRKRGRSERWRGTLLLIKITEITWCELNPQKWGVRFRHTKQCENKVTINNSTSPILRSFTVVNHQLPPLLLLPLAPHSD